MKGGWIARCPAHDDKNPSLSISVRDGKILLFCHAGCKTTAICQAARIELSQLFLNANSRPPVVATYDYFNENGDLLFEVVRYSPKDFKQRRPNGHGGWIWNLKSVRRVLYRLPEVLAATDVLVVEGEKDVHTANDLGFVATTNPGGAGAPWLDEYTKALSGKSRVSIIADADSAGRKHAEEIARSLDGKVRSLKVLELPNAKDVSAWVEQGGTSSALLKLIEEAPEWKPSRLEMACTTGQQAPKKTRATELLNLLQADAGCGSLELFHTPRQEAFVTFSVGRHREHWPLRSKRFREWLTRKAYVETGAVVSSQTLADVSTFLAGQAKFDGKQERVAVRLAESSGVIYLDLCDELWRAVAVTPNGWEIIDRPPVRFQRPPGLSPLPEPQKGGDVNNLFSFVNIRQRADRILFLAWLVAALRPSGPYPLLFIRGPHGSAKSTTAAIARALIDPSEAALNNIPRDERDLVIAASNSHVIALDNLSVMPPWLSDALCRIATGGGLRTRELYTDSDEVIFLAKRPVIVDSIEEIGWRGDLLDRMVDLCLPSLDERSRRDEKTLLAEFEDARPRLLGAILDGVSTALSNIEETRLDRLPRMADFALWAVAAAPALGFTKNEFLEAYGLNRAETSASALECSPIASVLIEFMEAQPRSEWMGTATKLLGQLNDRSDDELRRNRNWPRDARMLSNSISRIEPQLRAAGVSVERFREGHLRTRKLVLRMIEKASSALSSTPASQGSQEFGHSEDAGSGNRRTNPGKVPQSDKPYFPLELDRADRADADFSTFEEGEL
jgi:5S rRNA maturation endonuclease (ribonuclease M5)